VGGDGDHQAAEGCGVGVWREWAGWWRSWWIGWAVAGALLAGFALWQLAAPNGDLYQYRCFALAFWHGSATTASLPHCAGRLTAGPFPAFHVLPREYPPLALLVFSAPLLLGGAASMPLYVLGFNALMLACLGATAWLLREAVPTGQGGRRAAGWYVLWLALGSATIALVRYDAVPALLTVAAIARARRGPSRAAYVLLALATMLKLYPLLLLALLAVWDWRRTSPPNPLPYEGRGSQRQTSRPGLAPYSGTGQRTSPSGRMGEFRPPLSSQGRGWGGGVRWLTGPALAASVMVSIQLAADALTGVWGVPWLAVQGARPPQIESTAAGLLWLVEVIAGRGGQVHAVNAQRALALVGAPGGALATATLCLALLAIAWAAWALAVGRLAPERALAGSLLALLGGAAIFSPQYLIWASPLVALANLSPQPPPLRGEGEPAAERARKLTARRTDGGTVDTTVHGSDRTPAMNGRESRNGRAGGHTRAIAWGWSLVCAATTLIYSVGYLLGWPERTGWALAPFMALVLLRDGAVWLVTALLLRAAKRTGTRRRQALRGPELIAAAPSSLR
jgi:hypothetical protein